MAELLEATATQIPIRDKPNLSKHYPAATWLLVQREFVQGKGTLVALCEKHSVGYHTAKTRCHEEGWTDQRRAWLERARSALAPLPEPEPQKVPEPPRPALNTKLDQVEAQLVAIDEALVNAGVKDLPALWKAKSMALDAWSLLTGFERPGIRRRTKSRSAYQSAQPIEPDQPQEQPMPAKPMGWEYEG